MISTLFMLGGAACAFIAWAGWDDSPKYALVVLAAVVLFGAGIFTTPKLGGGSGDCYTDWDGRSNPTVCD